MKIETNLSPCHRKVRGATITVVAIGLLAIVIGVTFELWAAEMREDTEKVAARLRANAPTASSSFHDAERIMGDLEKFGLGKGQGIATMLSELEQCLPKNALVSRIQYKQSDGTLRLELEGDESEKLGEAVTALEKRFGRVRVLERQGLTGTGSKGIRLRLLVEEGTIQ